MYIIASRLDIMQAMGLVARFQACPEESHVIVVKRISEYIQGIFDYGLFYVKIKEFKLTVYIDVDWSGSMEDSKSTYVATFFLGNCLVS